MVVLSCPRVILPLTVAVFPTCTVALVVIVLKPLAEIWTL